MLAEMSPACKRLRNLISQRLRPIMQICPELLFSYTREIFMQRRAVCCTYGPAPTLHFNLSRAALSLSYQSRSQKLNNSLPQRVEQMLPLNGENVKLLKVRVSQREIYIKIKTCLESRRGESYTLHCQKQQSCGVDGFDSFQANGVKISATGAGSLGVGNIIVIKHHQKEDHRSLYFHSQLL